MRPTLRITGGAYRGRRIVVPPGEIRPAMDRMRESLFSILGDLSGLTFLDLFAGSGVMAVEACSRGAVRALSVERDGRKRKVLSGNLAIAGGAAGLVISPVETFLRRNRDRFDVIYLDPPFRYRDKTALLTRIDTSVCCADGGVVMIHHPGDPLPDRTARLERSDRRRYGGSFLDFYRPTIDR